MANMTKTQTIEQRWENRIKVSAPLLEKMGMSPAEYLRIALNALTTRPNLVNCTEQSLEIAVLKCLEAGLLPDGEQAAIVPFKNSQTGEQDAQLIPMIAGRRSLVRRATPAIRLRSAVVYRDDHFVHQEGLEPVLEHRPKPDADKSPGNIIAAYSIAVWPGNQTPEFEVMYRSDLDRARSFSRGASKSSSPWNTSYSEMARKSVDGRLFKRLPKRAGDPPDFPTGNALAAVDEFGAEIQASAGITRQLEAPPDAQATEAAAPKPAETQPDKPAETQKSNGKAPETKAEPKADPAPAATRTAQQDPPPTDEQAEQSSADFGKSPF